MLRLSSACRCGFADTVNIILGHLLPLFMRPCTWLCEEKYTVVKHTMFKITTKTYFKHKLCIKFHFCFLLLKGFLFCLFFNPDKSGLKHIESFCETVCRRKHRRDSAIMFEPQSDSDEESVVLVTRRCLTMVGVVSLFCLCCLLVWLWVRCWTNRRFGPHTDALSHAIYDYICTSTTSFWRKAFSL